MKSIKLELDVDFIGGQDTLTEAEQKALSIFFKERKAIVLSAKKPQIKKLKREKTFA